MPSFDVVSEVDIHEVNNALDQANREVGTRFDFKGIDASFSLTDKEEISVCAEVDFQIQQMLEILRFQGSAIESRHRREKKEKVFQCCGGG